MRGQLPLGFPSRPAGARSRVDGAATLGEAEPGRSVGPAATSFATGGDLW